MDSVTQYTGILDAWPDIKEDLADFIKDPNAWAIKELNRAYSKRRETPKDPAWDDIKSVTEVLELFESISHSH